jgi:hypothetical protein
VLLRRTGGVAHADRDLESSADAALMWASASATTNQNDAGAFMNGLAGVIVRELQKQGLVHKEQK